MGGVVVVILIAVAVWFTMRRKRSKRIEERVVHDEWTELQNTGGKVGFKRPSELGSQHGVSELGAGQRKEGRPGELWDPHSVSELSG